jgi:hypothetical protein
MKRTPSGQVVRRYQTYGLLGGIALGLLTGILVSGPHFSEWPVSRSLSLILCCVAGGALAGWALLAMAAGSLAGGLASDPAHLQDDDPSNDERRHQPGAGENDA